MPLFFSSTVCQSSTEREPASIKYRAAPGTAMTGDGDNDTPVQSQSERDCVFQRKAVAGNESSRQRTCRGVKFPWSWCAASRLMTSHSEPGRRGQIGLLEYKPDSSTGLLKRRERLYLTNLDMPYMLLSGTYIGGAGRLIFMGGQTP